MLAATSTDSVPGLNIGSPASITRAAMNPESVDFPLPLGTLIQAMEMSGRKALRINSR